MSTYAIDGEVLLKFGHLLSRITLLHEGLPELAGEARGLVADFGSLKKLDAALSWDAGHSGQAADTAPSVAEVLNLEVQPEMREMSPQEEPEELVEHANLTLIDSDSRIKVREGKSKSGKEGVEVVFPGKPSFEVRAKLKAAGFRWSPRQKLWYARRSATTLATAQLIQDGARRRFGVDSA